jgi:hypothetical protein
LKRGGRLNPKRKTPRKVSVERNRDYMNWLRETARCAIIDCRTPHFPDPAHTERNGMASKGADSSCVPLCRLHHEEQHYIGAQRFEEKYGVNLRALAAEHYQRWLMSGSAAS